MSQVCPSSSHQLVAASIAFQRARRRFPKNYGLCGNFEDKAESLTENEEPQDSENSQFSSRKCSRPAGPAKTVWSDERDESGSIKENLLQKPIICSCCRKRNGAAKANEPANPSKTTDQCSAGDALDIVPSKEYNEISKKADPSKSEQLDNTDVKTMKSFITESRNSIRCRTSYSHSRRRSPKETSAKLDSVNLLYDEGYDRVDNVKGGGGGSPEKRKCNTEEEQHCCGATGCRNSKLNLFGSCKDSSSRDDIHRRCDVQCAKHSNVDLSRSRRDFCRSQSRNRCCHNHNCCYHCERKDCRSCSVKEKPRLFSDTCLCSSNCIGHGKCCNSSSRGTTNEPIRRRDLRSKERMISTVQEQNDDEYEDCVAKIDHKDSLCILVEKYKASKKCKHRKYGAENDLPDDRSKDDCNKSFASEASQMDENASLRNRERCWTSDSRRFQENCRPSGKPCRTGCVQIFRDGDAGQIKNLKSRLVKTGTCCSAKGTPWRHTF